MPVFRRNKNTLRLPLLVELLFFRIDDFVFAEDIGIFFFILKFL